MARTFVEEIEIRFPSGVSGNLEGKVLKIKGPLGEVKRDFSSEAVSLSTSSKGISVKNYWAGKREKALVGTVAAHVRNMVKGVTEGYIYRLKKVYSHFPITIKVSGDRVIIENFIGERRPRMAKTVGNVKVTIKGEDIEVQGINLEEVSQTAANIQSSTKITKRDPRVFLDGVYIYEKTGGIASEKRS